MPEAEAPSVAAPPTTGGKERNQHLADFLVGDRRPYTDTDTDTGTPAPP